MHVSFKYNYEIENPKTVLHSRWYFELIRYDNHIVCDRDINCVRLPIDHFSFFLLQCHFMS